MGHTQPPLLNKPTIIISDKLPSVWTYSIPWLHGKRTHKLGRKDKITCKFHSIEEFLRRQPYHGGYKMLKKSSFVRHFFSNS